MWEGWEPAQPCPPNGAGSRPWPPPKESTEKVGQSKAENKLGWGGQGGEEGELGGRHPRQWPAWAQHRQSRAQESAEIEVLEGPPSQARFGVLCLGLIVPA